MLTPPALARAVSAEANLYARIQAEFGLHTASETGSILGSRSTAPRNLANALRKEGTLLAVKIGQRARYPGFQLDETGQPLPVIAHLVKLGATHDQSETGIVQWLMSPTTYLNGARPVDLLHTDPDRVLTVAADAWGVSW